MLKKNKKKIIKRSPLFYVGDKYKLMDQILEFIPKEINNFYEPFAGGGTVFLNIKANKYFINDFNKNLINIHNLLKKNSRTPNIFFNNIEKYIEKYKLSYSYKKDIVPRSLKKEFKKTYYAKFNKEGYNKLRDYLNNDEKKDPLVLYILLIYGFNRMLRFNSAGNFNLPVGNVDFNKNVFNALNNYFKFIKDKIIKFSSKDFRKFFLKIEFKKDDFVYIDPPYLITSSEYNKTWGDDEEECLLSLIDELNNKGIKFALSNVTYYKDKKNEKLINWMKKYNVHDVKSNYISYNSDVKKKIKEVLITNY